MDEALRLVGLDGFDTAYPHQISGGVAQRAALARIWRDRGFTALLVTHDAEEALLLANRLILVSDRPAHIRADVPVPLAYPRRRDDPELVRLRRERLELLERDS